jgi:polar amino acid transport system substrate-binding protein
MTGSGPVRRGAAGLMLLTVAALAAPAVGQGSDTVVIPNYWDARQFQEPAAPRPGQVVRFLVDDEYPPFHYADADGRLVGFSVDLARLICSELRAACTVQARRWDTLLDALAEERGDAVMAAMRITPAIKARFAVTQPYHRTPARFVARLGGGMPAPEPETLRGREVAVVGGSAHAAFLEAHFPGVVLRRTETLAQALAALKAGKAEFAFGDGVAIAFWLNGDASAGCCTLRGGAYLESRYFGEGIGVILRKQNDALARAIDQALAKLNARGAYAELYLKHFPISIY